jgi:murein DD-endopeptidase MepM/ murein hydrolase activator NlpD
MLVAPSAEDNQVDDRRSPGPERPRLFGRRQGPGKLPVTPSRKGRYGQNHRRQFSLLIVRGDGERVLRLNFPRPAVVAAGLALAVILSTTGVLVRDWLKLRDLTREAVTFHDQIQQQRVTIDTLNRRVVDIRQEMAGWRDLHAKIWEPLGPELTPRGRDRGIGGGTPTTDGAPTRLSPIEELNRLGDTVKDQTDNLKSLERVMARAGRMLATLPTRWPVRGSVNSEFGVRHSPWNEGREFHSGMDIRAERGTPIYAPASGTVVHAGPAQDYGTAIIIDHGQDIRTLYGHLSKLNVQHGQRVVRGTLIGHTGNTGRSSGPHLHYEIAVKGQAVNPRAYLWD